MLFAKISTGYKSGGFDNVGVYGPENLRAIEIGSKNKFMDNKLRLNASFFNYDYKDQQVSVFISTLIGGSIKNAGSTQVNGLDIEGEFMATPADKIRLNVNFLDAKFGDFPTISNVVSGDNIGVNLAGNRPIQSPRWTLIAGYDHNFTIGSGTLNVGIQTMFKSEYYLSPFNFNMDKQKSFTKTDAFITYTGKGGNWDIGFFAQNLEDNRVINYASFTGGTINIYNWIFNSPRLLGIQASYRFTGHSAN